MFYFLFLTFLSHAWVKTSTVTPTDIANCQFRVVQKAQSEYDSDYYYSVTLIKLDRGYRDGSSRWVLTNITSREQRYHDVEAEVVAGRVRIIGSSSKISYLEKFCLN